MPHRTDRVVESLTLLLLEPWKKQGTLRDVRAWLGLRRVVHTSVIPDLAMSSFNIALSTSWLHLRAVAPACGNFRPLGETMTEAT